MELAVTCIKFGKSWLAKALKTLKTLKTLEACIAEFYRFVCLVESSTPMLRFATFLCGMIVSSCCQTLLTCNLTAYTGSTQDLEPPPFLLSFSFHTFLILSCLIFFCVLSWLCWLVVSILLFCLPCWRVDFRAWLQQI